MVVFDVFIKSEMCVLYRSAVSDTTYYRQGHQKVISFSQFFVLNIIISEPIGLRYINYLLNINYKLYIKHCKIGIKIYIYDYICFGQALDNC